MFIAFMYANVQVTFVETNFLNRIQNRQPATGNLMGNWIGNRQLCRQLAWNGVIGLFWDPIAMVTALIYIYAQVTFIRTNNLNHSPNR